MKEMIVEVFSEATNSPVIRFPGRRYPGILIQGDTMLNFLASLKELASLEPGLSDFKEELEGLTEQWEALIRHYDTVLKESDIQLPYNHSV